ncbi:hypothetical protein [Thiohalocapsa marina]|uniref:hypothetical protein n=1 Tax=Thiohalocapsa marina TaxID=424902 RepID=UPI0036DF44FA
MRKPSTFFYYRVNPGEMELRCKGISIVAEGILARLMRVYFERERDIPATPTKIASLCGVSADQVQDAWEDLAEVIDLGGSEVRIPWFDDEIERQRRRSATAAQNASQRWGAKP